MNKIFRVIWNRTLNMFVVASELAHGRVKASSTGKKASELNSSSNVGRFALQSLLTAGLAVSALLPTVASAAHIILNSANNAISDQNSFNFANGSNNNQHREHIVYLGAKDQERKVFAGSVVIGFGAGQAAQNPTYELHKEIVAIGRNATTTGGNSVVVGANSRARGGQAVAVGSTVIANAGQTVAIGNDVIAGQNGAIAIGGDDLGDRAAIVTNGGEVVGRYTCSSTGGNDSCATLTADYFVTHEDVTAKIQNGQISVTHPDIFLDVSGTGQPVYRLKKAFLNNRENDRNNTYVYSRLLPPEILAKYREHKASGKSLSQVTGNYSVLRSGSKYGDAYSPTWAEGIGSIVLGPKSVALGDGSVAIGTMSYAMGNFSTVLGSGAYALGRNSQAIGNNAYVAKDNSVGVGTGVQTLDNEGMAYGYRAISAGQGSLAIGSEVYADAVMNTRGYLENNAGKTFYVHRQSLTDGDLGDELGLLGYAMDSASNVASSNAGFNKGEYYSKAGPNNGVGRYIDTLEKIITSSAALTPETILDNNTGVLKIKSSPDLRNSIVIGSRSASMGKNNIVLGRGAFARSANSMALGSYSYTLNENAMAVGLASRAFGKNSIAIGVGTSVETKATNSTVVGNASFAADESASIFGASSASYAKNTAIFGNNSTISQGADNSIIIGHDAFVSVPSGNSPQHQSGVDSKNMLAIGNEAHANLANSTALGYASKTDYRASDLLEKAWAPRGGISFRSESKVGVISVGSQGYERRIVNVAGGYRDTDAVNVSQLRALEDRIDAGTLEEDKVNLHFFSVNQKDGNNSNYTARRLATLERREQAYALYVRSRAQQLIMEARKKSGVQVDAEYERDLNARVSKLRNELGNGVLNGNALENNNIINTYNGSQQTPENYNADAAFAAVENARKADEERLKPGNAHSILNNDERAALKTRNFDNQGARGTDSIAIGYDAFTSNVVPNDPQTANAVNAKNAVAIGYEAKVETFTSDGNGRHLGNVAIGSHSVAYDPVKTRKVEVDGLTIGGDDLNSGQFAGSGPVASFSIADNGTKSSGAGNNAFARHLQGVAAGRITPTSTDAINGSQLFQVIKKIPRYVSVNSTETGNRGNNGAAAPNSIAFGPNASVGSGADSSLAIGHGANVRASGGSVVAHTNSVAIGYNAKAHGVQADNAVALGSAAWAGGRSTIAIGHKSFSNSENAIAIGQQVNAYSNALVIGNQAVATGRDNNANNSIAIGQSTQVVGDFSVAVGRNSQVGSVGRIDKTNLDWSFSQVSAVTGGSAFGESSQVLGNRGTALGNNAKVLGGVGAVALGYQAQANGDGNIAIGQGAAAQPSQGGASNITVIGRGASSGILNTVALGANSVATGATNVSSATLGEGNDAVSLSGFAGASPTGSVSVGNSSGTNSFVRQIHNVAAGRVTSDSTDAINGSQLYALGMLSIDFSTNQTNNGTISRRLGQSLGIVGVAGGAIETSVLGNNIQIDLTQEIKTKLNNLRTYAIAKKEVAQDKTNPIEVETATDAQTNTTTFKVGVNDEALAAIVKPLLGQLGAVTTLQTGSGTNAKTHKIGEKNTALTITGTNGVTASVSTATGDTGNGTLTIGLDTDTQNAINKVKNGGGITFKDGATPTAGSKKVALDKEFSILGSTHVTTTVEADGDNGKVTIAVKDNGAVAANNAGLVTGGTVHTALETAKTNILNQVNNNANLYFSGNKTLKSDGSEATEKADKPKINLGSQTLAIEGDGTLVKTTAKGQTVSIAIDETQLTAKAKDAAKGAVKVIAGTNTTVTEGTEGDFKTYAVNVSNEAIQNAAAGANLKYKAGTEATAKDTALSTGLHFQSGNDNITAATEANGVVKYTLASALTSIASIANGSNDQGAKITLGETDKNITVNGGKITGLAEGQLNSSSTDAITGKQLTSLATALGLSVAQNNDTSIAVPSFSTAIQTVKHNEQATLPGSPLDATRKLITAVNEGLKFAADGAKQGTTQPQKQYLGSTLQVKSGSISSAADFVGDNLKTEYDYNSTTGVGTITVGMTKNLTNITSISNGGTGDSKTTITLGDRDGNKVVDFGGAKITNIGEVDADLAYRANGTQDDVNTAKKVKINKGLNFVNTDNITTSVENDGVVKHTLNAALKGITSIKNTENGPTITIGDGTDSNKTITITNVEKVDLGDAKLNAKIYYIANGTAQNAAQKKSVSISDGFNFKDGTHTTASVDNNGVVSFDLNEAAANAITRATSGGITFAGINATGATGSSGSHKVTLEKTFSFEGNSDLTAVVSETSDAQGSTGAKVTLTVKKDGEIAKDNTGLVTGGTVKDYVDRIKTSLQGNLDGAVLRFRGDNNPNADLSSNDITKVNLKDAALNIQGSVADPAAAAGSEGVHFITTKAEGQKLTIGIDADKFKAEVATAAKGSAKLAYKAGDDNNAKEVTLGTGLTFKSGNTNIIASTSTANPADGVITYSLAENLSDISSISGKPASNNSNTTKMVFGADNITFSTVQANGTPVADANPKLTGLAAGTVSDTSSDAIVGKQLKAALDSIKAALGGGAGLVNGTNDKLTNPTFTLTGVDKVTPPATDPAAPAGTQPTPTSKNNVGDAISALDSAIGALSDKLGDATIAYKSRNPAGAPATGTTDSDAQTTKLSDGLIFEGDNNVKTTAEDGGVTKFALNKKLSGITSITGDENTAQITFEQNQLKLNDKKLTGLTSGSIAADSKDAVTGHQINSLATALGLTTTDNLFTAPSFTAVQTEAGTQNAAAITSVKAAIDATISAVNSGIKFGADATTQNGTNPQTQYLGSTLNVKAATNEYQKADDATKKFVGSNLLTVYEYANGVGTINIAMSKTPTFDSVKVADRKPSTVNDNAQTNPTTGYGLGEAANNVATEAAVRELHDKLVKANSDGLKFKGNANGTTDPEVARNLGETLRIQGQETTTTNGQANPNRPTSFAADNIVVDADTANGKLEIKLSDKLKNINSIALTNYGGLTIAGEDPTKPAFKLDKNGITITPAPKGNETPKPVSLTNAGLDNGGNVINNVASAIPKTEIDGVASTDNSDFINSLNGAAEDNNTKHSVVNVTDLANAMNFLFNEDTGGFALTADDKNGTDAKIAKSKLGGNIQIVGDDKNISTSIVELGPDGNKRKAVKISFNNELSIGKAGDDGEDGKLAVNGKDGSAVVINGKDGSIGLTGPAGQNGTSPTVTIRPVSDGKPGVDGADGTTTTRVVYEVPSKDPNGQPTREEIATLNDGMKFTGNNGATTVVKRKLNELLTIKGDRTDPAAGTTATAPEADSFAKDNIWVDINSDQNPDSLVIKLNKDLKNITSISSKAQGADANATGATITLATDANKVSFGNAVLDGVKSAVTPATNQSFNDALKEAAKDTDKQSAVVNVKDLADAMSFLTDSATGGFGLIADDTTDPTQPEEAKTAKAGLGENIQLIGDGKNISTAVVDKNGKKAVKISFNDTLEIGAKNEYDPNNPTVVTKEGKDGSLGVNGKNGSGVQINGADGSIGLTGPRGNDGTAGKTINIKMDPAGKGGVADADTVTKPRITYEEKLADGTTKIETLATLNDGLKFIGNDGNATPVKRSLNEQLIIKGQETATTNGQANPNRPTSFAADNIVVDVDNTQGAEGLVIKLSDKLQNINSISNGTGDNKTTITLGDTNGGKVVDFGGAKITGISNVDADLAYRANGTENNVNTAKKVKINKGLNFVNTTNITTSVEDDGVVKHTLNEALKNITEISSKPTDPDNPDPANADKAITTISLGKDTITLGSKAKNGTDAINPKLTGLGSGSIAANSKDAITGHQLNSLATALGLTPANNVFTVPTFATINKGHIADGATGLASSNIKTAVDNLISTVNDGIQFGATAVKAGQTNPNRQNLGTTLKVVEGDLTSAGNTHFKGKNLKTEYAYEDGVGTISIGLTETPEFKAVELKGTDGVNGTTTTIDAGGVKVKDTNNPAKTLAELGKDKLEIVTGATQNPDGTSTDNKLVIGKDGTDANAKGVITGLADRKVNHTDANDTYGKDGNAGRAATEGAVRDLADKLKEKSEAGLEFIGSNNDATKKVKRQLGELLTVTGEGTELPDEDATAANNIRVDTDNTNKALVIKLAKALKNITSVQSAALAADTDGDDFTLANGTGLTFNKVENAADAATKVSKTSTTNVDGLTAKKTSAEGVADVGVSTTGLTLQDIARADPNATDALTKQAALSINNLHFKQSNSPADGAKGNDGEANYGLTEASIKDKDNNAFTANATSVTLQDNNAENKAVLSKTGVVTSNADDTSNLGATSLVFSKTVAAGAQPTDQTSATLDRTSLEFKATDGTSVIKLNSTDKTAKIGNITINGSDTKLVNVADVIKLDGASSKITISTGTNKAIEIGKDGTSDTGKITGLTARNAKDNAADYGLGDNAGRAATESAVKTLSDKLRGAASPFEYVDAQGKPLEKGQDGKFYDAEKLKDAVWNPTEKRYELPAGTELAAADTTGAGIRARPEENLPKRLALGNIDSGIGLGNYGTDATEDGTPLTKFDANVKDATAKNGIVAARTAADKLYALDGDKLGNVATVGDLQAIAVAGLTFKGNAADPFVHRKLSDTLVIKGEVDTAVNPNALAQDAATAAGNIRVDVDNNDLIIKLAKAIKNIDSIESEPAANGGSSFKLSKDDGLTLTKKAADGATTENVTNVEGSSITETNANGEEIRTATYDINGVNVADANGNEATLNKDGLEVENDEGESTTVSAKEVTVEDANGNRTSLEKSGVTAQNGTDQSNLTADKLVIGPQDPNATDKHATEITRGGVTLKGKDGNDAISLNANDKTAKIGNVTISGANDTQGENAASITGLANRTAGNTLDDQTPGQAATSGYGIGDNVGRAATEGAVRELADKLDLQSDSSPFEYVDTNGAPVLKGKDGKFYTPADLKGATWIADNSLPGGGKYVKGTDTVASVDDNTVTIKAKGEDARKLGNVASGIGLTDYAATAPAQDAPAGTKPTLDKAKARTAATSLYDLSGSSLNNAVTTGDLQAIAISGFALRGNHSTNEVHRKLGDFITVKGENDATDTAPASAKNNIYVDINNDQLIIKLAQAITNITSIESKNFKDGTGTGFKLEEGAGKGLTVTEKAADGKVTKSETKAGGTTITGPAGADGKNASATYGLDGATIKGADGSSSKVAPDTIEVTGPAGAAGTPTAGKSDKTTIKPASVKVEDKNGNTAELTPTEIKLADAAGKNNTSIGNDKISITKGKDGTNGKDGVDLTAENIRFSSTAPADKSTATLGKDGLTFTNKAGKETIKIDGEKGTISGIKSGTKTFEAPMLDGKPLKQANDGKWYLADDVNDKGQPVDDTKKPAILMADDGKYYKADQVTAGKAAKGATAVEVNKGGLVDFANSDASAVATVGDLQGLGFVVSTSDKSGGTETYKDQVRHGNQLNVTGSKDGLVSVKGKTDENGKRELVVDVKRGVIVPQGERFAVDKEGKPLVKVGEGDTAKYYRPEDIGANGQPNDGATAVEADKVATTADGEGFVTGNQVGAALSKSGFIVGKGDAESMLNRPTNRDERINPEDEIRFADGKNSVVTMTTKEDVDATGNKKTVTTVRVDVDLPIKDKYTIADPTTGEPKEVVKAKDGKFYDPKNVNEFGKPKPGATPVDTTTTPVKRDVQLEGETYAGKDGINGTNGTNANAGTDQTKDEIKKGTGGVNINNVAWAENPDQAVNKDQLDQTVAKSGFFVKQNGEAVKTKGTDNSDLGAEKVTPNDAVNFVNGGNTIVNVETKRDADGVDTTNISVHLTGLPMSYTAKVNGKDTPITKVVTKDGETKFYAVGEDGKPVLTNADGSSAEIPAGALANAGMALNNALNAPNEVSKDPVRISNVAAATQSLPTNTDFETREIGGKIYDARDVEVTYEAKNSDDVLVKIGDNFYKPADVEIKQGKLAPKENATKVNDVVTVDGLAYAKDNVEVVGEKRKSGTEALTKIGDDYYRTSDVKDGKAKAGAVAVNKIAKEADNKAFGGLADLNSANDRDVLTVNDAKRMGFVVGTRNSDPKASKDLYAGKVQNANKLEFIGGNNIEVVGADKGNNREVTIRMVENPEFASVNLYAKDQDGNRIAGTTLRTDINGNLHLSRPLRDGNGNAVKDAQGNPVEVPVIVSGIAPGRIEAGSTDAVTGGQVHELAEGFSKQLQGSTRQLSAGIAGAYAMAGLIPSTLPGERIVSVAGGHYKGQNAVAIGISATSDNGRFTLRASGSRNSTGEFGASIGAGYRW